MRLAAFTTWITVAILLAVSLASGRAAVPVTPELQRMREHDRVVRMQLDADYSLHEKMEVGRQRYARRQTFEQEIINGMRANLAERRAELASLPGNVPAMEETQGAEHGQRNLATAIASAGLLIAGLLLFWFVKKYHQVEQ